MSSTRWEPLIVKQTKVNCKQVIQEEYVQRIWAPRIIRNENPQHCIAIEFQKKNKDDKERSKHQKWRNLLMISKPRL